MRHVLLLSAVLLPGVAQAATFQSFDVPGAYGTCGAAIASNGLVAGNILQQESVGVAEHAAAPAIGPFLYAAGQFSYPRRNLPQGDVVFSGVNRFRFIIGTAYNAGLTPPFTESFVYHHGAVSAPSAAGGPAAFLSAVTDSGVLLGAETPAATGELSFPRTLGVLLRPDGTVTTIDDGSPSVSPRGLDASAERVVGTSLSATNPSWMFQSGSFTPVAFPGASFTVPTGVDEAGTITGYYFDGDVSPGTPAYGHGFFLRHGRYARYDVPRPGVLATYIQGMNEAEQVTGCYTDAKGTHGFLRTP